MIIVITIIAIIQQLKRNFDRMLSLIINKNEHDNKQ